MLAAERRFRRARLFFGHGTDNARDEAVFLVFHALGYGFDSSDAVIDTPLEAAAISAVKALIDARITRRCPAAYLTGRMWFAGHEFAVDENVLIPRSPIGELLRQGFAPWVEAAKVSRILDIGTGSGCIAVAAAHAFPTAEVDATDISQAALAVAARNVAAHGMGARVPLHEADLFPTGGGTYDLILANPPYVPESERRDLPAEYLHEPALALFAPDEGLALVKRILTGAVSRLSEHGVLVLDVGGSSQTLEAAYPRFPFLWVELQHGGDGITVISRAELARLPLQ